MNISESSPLFQTVKKHGSSKLFLKAFCFSLAGAVLNLALRLYNAIGILTQLFSGKEGVEYTMGDVILNMAESIVAFAFSFVTFYGLLRAYRYYSGKTDKSDGLDIAIYSIAISLFYECLRMVVGLFTEYTDFNSAILGFAFLLLVLLFSIMFFKAMRLSIQYPKNAEENSPRGQISGLIIASLITVLIVFAAYTAVQLYLAFQALYTPAAEGMEAERAAKINESIQAMIGIIVLCPTMASYAFYLKLIKFFRREMNEAREEWAAIEKKNKRSDV